MDGKPKDKFTNELRSLVDTPKPTYLPIGDDDLQVAVAFLLAPIEREHCGLELDEFCLELSRCERALSGELIVNELDAWRLAFNLMLKMTLVDVDAAQYQTLLHVAKVAKAAVRQYSCFMKQIDVVEFVNKAFNPESVQNNNN